MRTIQKWKGQGHKRSSSWSPIVKTSPAIGLFVDNQANQRANLAIKANAYFNCQAKKKSTPRREKLKVEVGEQSFLRSDRRSSFSHSMAEQECSRDDLAALLGERALPVEFAVGQESLATGAGALFIKDCPGPCGIGLGLREERRPSCWSISFDQV